MLRGRHRTTVVVALAGVVLLSAVVGMAAVVGAQAMTDSTQAPDLQTVDNFRQGTSGGEQRTLVDFTFDEELAESGSSGNFELVPIDGSGVLDGQNIERTSGTRVTVAFADSLSSEDIARGIVQPKTVQGANSNGAINPLQTADVSNGGNSADPDLVNVTVNRSTNSLVYAFDEPVSATTDSGFQVYDQDANEYDGNTATDSLATPRLVNVTFDDFNVADAVGASITQGTVQNTSDSTRTNSPDEVVVSAEPAPEFTRCGDGSGGTADMGDGGGGGGPTIAPDLVDIDNFTYRQNPEDDNCQTLVEFDFDEPVNTQGGAGNFQLVPNDSRNFQNQVGDGNNEIIGPKSGTTSLTVPFDGRIDPDAFVRGFVDANTVQTADEGDETLNPKQAADLNNGGNSANPDLVSVSVGGENELLFTFDEPIDEIGSTGSFQFYDSNATVRNSLNATITDDRRVVSATYAPKFDAGSSAVGASVTNGAVSGTDTDREDGDTNQFDEVEITGPVVGDNTPTDPDGDGRFEDVNGDGEFDVSDVQALFANRNSISADDERFDFNGDGTFDVSDVQALFTEQTSDGGSSAPAPVVGSNSPTDPDNDGRYEDVNGDGEFDVSDVQALFANRGEINQREDSSGFDFNGDGEFDVSDVQALFQQR